MILYTLKIDYVCSVSKHYGTIENAYQIIATRNIQVETCNIPVKTRLKIQ